MSIAQSSLIIIKIGGSLLDMPQLGREITLFVQSLLPRRAILIVGGGSTANLVRQWDETHELGEERSHWLALSALKFNGGLVTELVPDAVGCGTIEECDAALQDEMIPILDPVAFARWLASPRPGNVTMPHSWEVTSDSVAAYAAMVLGATELMLLKSTDCPADCDLLHASQQGLIDRHLPDLATRLPEVTWVNFRRRPAARVRLRRG